MPRAEQPATADDGSSTAAAPEPSMTSVSTTTVTDPSSVNTESAGVEDAESSQGGKPAQPEPDKDLTAEEEALLTASSSFPRPKRPPLGGARGGPGHVPGPPTPQLISGAARCPGWPARVRVLSPPTWRVGWELARSSIGSHSGSSGGGQRTAARRTAG